MITLTDACRPDVRRALQTDPGVLLVGRSADSSGWAIDRCISDVYIAAEHLAQREGVDVRHLVPNPKALIAHHRTAAVAERTHTIHGATVVHRWSVWTAPASALTVLLSTGSARAVTADGLDQPAVLRVARVVHETRPTVVFAQSLTQIGRGYPGALIDVLQAIGETRADGPFLGDTYTSLSRIDANSAMHLAVQGITTAATHRRFANQPRLPDGRFAGRRSGAGDAR
jgi:hypothetical protein